MSEEYAFGVNEFGKVPCPATAAGFSNKEMKSAVVGKYDNKVIKIRAGRAAGIVPEHVAREKWLEMIPELELRPYKEFAREVARELGWLDDGE